jgi:hypothetical protein
MTAMKVFDDVSSDSVQVGGAPWVFDDAGSPSSDSVQIGGAP